MRYLIVLFLLLCLLFTCSTEAQVEEMSSPAATVKPIDKIAGYDVSHLGLQADDFDVPYQKISGKMLLWLAASECDTALFLQVLRREENPLFAYEGDHLLTEIAFCEEKAVFMAAKIIALGEDINSTDAEGDSFLSYAISMDNLDLVRFILQKGGDLQQRNSNEPLNCLPIHSVESVQMLELLLEAGADVTGRCGNGRTLLHFAAREGLPELAEFLLKKELVDPTLRDNDGASALDYAEKFQSPEVAALLHH